MSGTADFYRDKNVLITGGLGFIGSNLARKLVDLGSHVTLMDSLIPEYGGNRANVSGLESEVTINISDVRDTHSMATHVAGRDLLFNLAGQTSHIDSMSDPYSDLEINCRAQLSILEACRQWNPTVKVIYASTRQIYGKPDYLPADETHPLRPVDVNGINKMAGEWYHILYNNVYGIRATALRLTNTYGPRMRIKDARQTFLGVWIRRIIEGQTIEVWGGDQLRDFTYVDDACDAFLLAGASDAVNGRVFNLGGDQVINLRDTAKLLIDVAGAGDVEVRPYPEDRLKIDIGDYYADDRLIRATLGWSPTVPLVDGLARTLEFFREHLPSYL